MTSWYNTISQKRIPSSVEEKQRSFLFYSIVESLKKGTKRVMQKLQQQKNCILHNRFYIRNEGQYAKKSQQLCLTSWIVNFRSVRAVGKTCTCLLVWFRFRFFFFFFSVCSSLSSPLLSFAVNWSEYQRRFSWLHRGNGTQWLVIARFSEGCNWQ